MFQGFFTFSTFFHRCLILISWQFSSSSWTVWVVTTLSEEGSLHALWLGFGIMRGILLLSGRRRFGGFTRSGEISCRTRPSQARTNIDRRTLRIDRCSFLHSFFSWEGCPATLQTVRYTNHRFTEFCCVSDPHGDQQVAVASFSSSSSGERHLDIPSDSRFFFSIGPSFGFEIWTNVATFRKSFINIGWTNDEIGL